jgi:SAM-dependent methyltransferase
MATSDVVFTGSIPQLYDRHLAALLFAPYARDLAARLGSLTHGRLLETAAGTGIATEALATALPEEVEIVATDLNQPMLEHAASKPTLARVDLRQADALALPFDDTGFEAVACQFGVMFFPDRVAGFREAHRVLKPGGRFVFSVWDSASTIPLYVVLLEALRRLYPARPSWFLERVPCGYCDPARIEADLRAAGFASPRIETVTLTGHAASPLDPAIGLCQGTPMRAEIEALDPSGPAAATQAVAAEVVRRFGDGPFAVKLQALVIDVTR